MGEEESRRSPTAHGSPIQERTDQHLPSRFPLLPTRRAAPLPTKQESAQPWQHISCRDPSHLVLTNQSRQTPGMQSLTQPCRGMLSDRQHLPSKGYQRPHTYTKRDTSSIHPYTHPTPSPATQKHPIKRKCESHLWAFTQILRENRKQTNR